MLVIDCTAFGDVSRLLLGGRQPHAKAAVAEQHADGRSTAHLLAQLLPPAAAAAAAAPLTPGRAAPDAGGARGAASWAAGEAGASIAERFGLPVSQVRCWEGAGGWLAATGAAWPAACLPEVRRASAAVLCQHPSLLRAPLLRLQVNPHIPMPNLLLIPSGATKQQPCASVGPADIL